MESKYKLEQRIWFMHENVPCCEEIRRIRQTKSLHTDYMGNESWLGKQEVKITKTEVLETEYEVYMRCEIKFMPETKLFPSKEELIKSL